MLDIPKVSKRTLKTLDTAGWTIEKLSEAQPEDLTVIDGIGTTTAWRIIVGARRLHRAEKAGKPMVIDEQWIIPPPAEAPPKGIYIAPPTKPEPPGLAEMSVEQMEVKFRELAPGEEMPQMAVRIKRNWLRGRLRELMA